MRSVRQLVSLAIAALAAVALLAACAQPEAAPSSTGTATPRSPANAPAGPPAAAAPHGESCGDDQGAAADADACGAAADACGDNASAADTAQLPALRRVASEQVCMRSNRFMGKPQLSAEVEGRAYFGCCAGCTKGLSADAAARTAKDPVTGRAVDKGSAVIGARPDGSVVYFENEETFRRAGGA